MTDQEFWDLTSRVKDPPPTQRLSKLPLRTRMRVPRTSKDEIIASNAAILFGGWVIVIALLIIARGLYGHLGP